MGLLQPEWLYYHYFDYEEDEPPNADPQPRPTLASAPVNPPASAIRIRLHARRE
ncbi:hypothetical protein [Polycladomyces subterraneus]|uniref:Uncharacterized protein n=1 Tax=Polycladomyces subterraneus TaxID=1016997 RepID=A0ABT8IJE1_9BACL|nr:hypothetical protein [Polycladomyces subterraneus]MDN4592858.1 hypothetical protein [Polycladomyces subterraneus]